MFVTRKLAVRPATAADHNVIATLARFEECVHAHLDWRPIEDWLGAQPFLVAERGRRVVGALACPPDPPDTAWVRLFAISDGQPLDEMWNLLWPLARRQLEAQGVKGAAGMSLQDWMEPLYESAGFERTHTVVVLSRSSGPLAAVPSGPARIRPAQPEDHPAIIAADTAAFAPPWQMSPEVLRVAIAQAGWLTVAEVEGRIVGYQLATPSHDGAHLARLAVCLDWQGRGIGQALVADLVDHYNRRGAHRLTVNTQDSNAASLAVYRRLGFQLNGARYPVFQLALG